MLTRSKSKTFADATFVEAERTQCNDSPSTVRPAPIETIEGVSALPASSVAQAIGSTLSGASQPFNDTCPSDCSSQCQEGNARTQQTNAYGSFCSKQTASERTYASRSSATVHAQRLALEADSLRRRLQRERDLARLESETEQKELEAKLAALDTKVKSAKSRSSRCSSRHCHTQNRIASWVFEQNANMTMVANVPGEAPTVTLDNIQGPFPQSVVPANTVPLHAPNVNHANSSKLTHAAGNENDVVTTRKQQQLADHTPVDSIAKLAHAITALSERPQKPELIPFSGDVSQWLAFKSSYDRTKSSFSPAENLTRLNNAVRGPAYQSVASLLWTSRDPQEVIDALQQTYARPEILVAREVSDLLGSFKLTTPEQLNLLANKLRNFVTTIKILNQNDYLYSPELFRCILLKLSEHTRARFTDFAATYSPTEQSIPKLELLSRFLLIEADKQLKYNFVSDGASASAKPQNQAHFLKPFLKKETVHATTSSTNVPKCSYCKETKHVIKTCKLFLSLAVDDRWQWVRNNKICYRCLKSIPHSWNSCRAKRCGVDGCTRRHNSLLHGQSNANIRVIVPSNAQCNNTEIVSNPTTNTNDRITETKASVNITNTDLLQNVTGPSQWTTNPHGLLKILPIVLEGPDGEYETTALLDEGSTATLIDGDVAARIGATPTRRERVRLEGVGEMSKIVDVSYVNFHIRGRNLPDRYMVKDARAIKPLSLRAQKYKVNLQDYDHLATLSIDLSITNDPPTVLIGAPDWHLSISREVRCGNKNEPVASRTLLGWVLHGALSVSSKPLECINHVCDDLDALIKSQYDIDALGITKNAPRQNTDDTRAINLIDTSCRRLADGRFEVSLPWKEHLPKIIPDSYPQALSRFKALEKQMSKDPSFETAFKRFIEDILSKGYAEECDLSTYHKNHLERPDPVSPNVRWYLPIFGVFHPQKRKLRAVHDAAAVTRAVSLNSLLLQGPDLLQPLLDVLFRFREGAVALNADIKEMFPQVKIAPKDRDAQRFLWRSEGTIREYRMASMIFGAVCSPFIALYLKDKNAKELEATYPDACNAIVYDHYMDDYLGSHTNMAEAARIASEIVTVHKNCQFEMRSWTSNVPEALSQIPKALRSDSADVYLPPNNEVGVLGVKWNPAHDTLSFRSALVFPSDVMTKRTVLSNVMKLYDPLGLLMPVTIWGRIIIQKLWREGIGWDTPLPEKYATEYKSWFQHLQDATSVKIPRWYFIRQDHMDIHLHIVADGGEQAYACVAYWRMTYTDGSVSVVLIGSKARVAPLKPLSIPRLELQAALIASRFSLTIKKAHRLKPSQTTFWTDSTTVLKWIRSDARNFKPFVAHRLGEIAELSNPSDWRWLPTSLNVADDATKPKTQKLSAGHRWFSGPPFLSETENHWPKETPINVETLPDFELKSEIVGLLVDASPSKFPVPCPKRFSSWLRLLRATARVLQCARIFRSKIARSPNINSVFFKSVGPGSTTSLLRIQAADLNLAEKTLLLQSQSDSFTEEIKHLRASQPPPKASRIASLAAFVDNDGLLRVDTRIRFAPTVSDDMKAPVILDGRHDTVRLLIRSYHVKMAHGFDETVLNELRQKFWILNARSTIKSVSSSCTGCRRFRGHPITPPTGDLPVERLNHHTRPFTYTGLDYFGPFIVAVGRRQEKRYVALYTCLVTRAVHLEIISSLSSDAALTSLRRFIARRGSPAQIFSDNGTNFVGANRELKSLHDDSVIEYATNERIEWRFIPPASPFMGGAWERLVRTVKNALRASLKDRSHPKDDVFATLLLEAEAIVNSRPLTYVPSATEAPESITPFHFLIGTSSVTPWTTNLTDADLSRRQDWRRVLRLADHFWARWLREYLPMLRRREPRNRSQDLKEGDVVLIADATLPRGLWPLGRVVKTHPGSDGRVRVVDLLTKGGTLRRPTRKLVVIEPQPAATEC